MELENERPPEAGGTTSGEGWLGGRRWRLRTAVAAASVVAAAAGALPAAAQGQTETNQQFRVVSAGPPGAQRTVIASGVITGVGSEVIMSNPVGGTTAVATLAWTFPQGTLFVTATYTFTNVLDPRTCLRTVTLTGIWEITGGTGEFAGATGGGEFSGTNRILLQRSSDQCVPPPVVLVQTFSFTGNVTLAGTAAA